MQKEKATVNESNSKPVSAQDVEYLANLHNTRQNFKEGHGNEPNRSVSKLPPENKDKHLCIHLNNKLN